MPQTRYDITWRDPSKLESQVDFKQTPNQIIQLLSWSLVDNYVAHIYSISKCAE